MSLLQEKNVHATVKQVSEKLINLKNYYGEQKILMENSKNVGQGEINLIKLAGSFLISCAFLKDVFTPRETHKEDLRPFAMDNPPSTKPARKVVTGHALAPSLMFFTNF